MHKMDKQAELAMKSDFGVAHESDEKAANTKHRHGSSSFFKSNNRADTLGMQRVCAAQCISG